MLKSSRIKKMVAVFIFFAVRGFFAAGLILPLSMVVLPSQAFAQGGTWTTKAPMLQGVHDLAAVEVNGTIYRIGGWPGNTCGGGGGRMEAYDPVANTWTPKASLNTPRAYAGAGVVNGIIYVVGGAIGCGFYTNSIEAYDPSTNSWTFKSPMLTDSWHSAVTGVVVVNSILYAFSADGRTDTVQAYDPATDTWSYKASMPIPGWGGFGVAVVDSIIYALGGWDYTSGRPVMQVYAYDPGTNTWRTMGTIPRVRVNHSAAALNGIIYLVGGVDPSNYLAEVDAYVPKTNIWINVDPIPTPRSLPATAAANGSIYALGGITPSVNGTAAVEAFTPNQLGGTWATLASMSFEAVASSGGVFNGELYVASDRNRPLQVYSPTMNTWASKSADLVNRTYTAAGFIDSKLYVADGATNADWNSCTNRLLMFDPASNAYIEKSSSPTARATASYGVVGNKLYVAGGNGSNPYFPMSLLEVYDPATNSWTRLANMSFPQRQAGSAVGDGKLYVIGGYDRCDYQSCNPTGRLQVYDPATNTWTEKAPMPTPRHSLVCAVLDGIIYCIGGGNNAGYLNTVEAYDPVANSWTTSTQMPTARAGMVAGVINRVIYVAGGSNASGAVKVLEAFTPIQSSFNQPPVLNLIGNKDVREGELLEFTVTTSDPNVGDSLCLTVSNLPMGATFTSVPGNPVNGVFSWTPNYDQAASYPNIIFTVTDNGNPPASASEAITITAGNVNRPPVISPIGNKVVNENQALQFKVDGTDPDGDALNFSVGNLPSGASFDSSIGTFTWTPSYEQAGNYQNIIFTVTDSAVPPASASETITITVSNVNRPPVLSPIGGKSVNEGETLLFTVTATDPDGDQLFYSASNLPPGASFDPVTQVFSWTPAFEQAGTHLGVEFTVMDNREVPELAVELITITVGNVNRAPVFTPVGVQSVNEWDTLHFSVSATDYDGNAITYSSSAPLPVGATFDPVTRIFTWTPTSNQAGTYTAVFYATDNDSQDPKTGQLEVVISVSVPTPLDLGKDIEDSILVTNLSMEVFNSYWSNVKKVRPFIEKGNFAPAVNQLSSFIKKVAGDIARGEISQADGEGLIAMASELIRILGY